MFTPPSTLEFLEKARSFLLYAATPLEGFSFFFHKKINQLKIFSFFSVDPLFSNDEQDIDVEWMRKVFPDEDEETDDDLADWTKKLTDQEVVTVGDLKEQSKEDLRAYGIPGAIASGLYDRCHPKP